MKALRVLSMLGAVTMLLVTAVVPAWAQTPAERAREIATALQKDPLYVDPVYASALPQNLRTDVAAKASALGFPVYSMVLPLSPGDVFQGQEQNALTLVIDALRKPGLYVVVNGGSRFPWYEAHELPQVSEDKLRAARKRALDDTEYDAGPTQVLARMYQVLADPSLPVPKETTAPSRRDSDGDSDDSSAGTVTTIVVAGIVALVVLGLVIGLVRRGGGRPAAGRTRGEKTFSIPPHVAATVAAERRRRLTRETAQELTTLGSQLAALPDARGLGLRHQQAALDAHHAAGKVLDSSEDLVDVVGAMVLLDKARREYDAARAVAADRPVADVPELCAFNPLHGRSTGSPTQVESDGATVTLPLCADCRRALKRGTAPASLPGEDGPYWHGTDLWARTFFGALGEDLASAVARGEYRS
ncbi:hypothetical protein ACI2LF_03045 [Kribbella sp. NPDC020789]